LPLVREREVRESPKTHEILIAERDREDVFAGRDVDVGDVFAFYLIRRATHPELVSREGHRAAFMGSAKEGWCCECLDPAAAVEKLEINDARWDIRYGKEPDFETELDWEVREEGKEVRVSIFVADVELGK
jgi:hypothetical protein